MEKIMTTDTLLSREYPPFSLLLWYISKPSVNTDTVSSTFFIFLFYGHLFRLWDEENQTTQQSGEMYVPLCAARPFYATSWCLNTCYWITPSSAYRNWELTGKLLVVTLTALKEIVEINICWFGAALLFTKHSQWCMFVCACMCVLCKSLERRE